MNKQANENQFTSWGTRDTCCNQSKERFGFLNQSGVTWLGVCALFLRWHQSPASFLKFHWYLECLVFYVRFNTYDSGLQRVAACPNSQEQSIFPSIDKVLTWHHSEYHNYSGSKNIVQQRITVIFSHSPCL